MWAAAEGQAAVVEPLLAAKAVDLDMMRLLLDLGADPRLTNEDGTTALLVAGGGGIWSSSESPGSAGEALEAVNGASAGPARLVAV